MANPQNPRVFISAADQIASQFQFRPNRPYPSGNTSLRIIASRTLAW